MKKILHILLLLVFITQIQAQDIYLTDGANAETVGNVFYSDQSQGIFITGCLGTSLFNPCNLVIIPNTDEITLNGDTLIDFFGNQNTLASFQFCGGVIDLLIHAINPNQPNTYTQGQYDVVLDMDQNGHFNIGIDVLFASSQSDFFFEIIDVPHDTTLSYPINQTVFNSKAFAFAEAERINKVADTTYYSLYKNNLAMIDRLENFSLSTIITDPLILQDLYNLVRENKEILAIAYQDGASNVAVKTAASYILSGDAVPNFGGGIAEFIGIDYNSLVTTSVLDKVKQGVYASHNMYLDIAADPPIYNYAVLEDINPNINYGNDLDGVDFFFKSDKNAIELFQLLKIESAADYAYLKTLERLQGAKQDLEYDYMRFQNQHLKNIISLLIQIKIAEKSVINNYKSAYRFGIPISKDSIQNIINEIQVNGFSQSVIDDAINRGLSMSTINELKNQVIAFDTASISYGTQWEDSLLVGFDLSIMELELVLQSIDSLEALFLNNNIPFPLCAASIAGPDSAEVNQNFTLSNIMLNNNTSDLVHWKPYNTFGNSSSISEEIPGYFLYQVTNKNAQGGVLNRAFKLMHIVMPNINIPILLDTTNFYTIYESDTITLKTQQNSSDANGLIITWEDNGQVIAGANQNSLTYIAPNLSIIQAEYHLLKVTMHHPSFPTLTRTQTWMLKVLPDSVNINNLQDSTIYSYNYSTASNGSGGFLPVGTRDLNWTFSSGNTINDALNGTFDSAYVCGQAIYLWLYPSIEANWISINPYGNSNGFLYHAYKCNIELNDSSSCGQNLADNYVLNLDFAWDDFLENIFVNGIPQTSYTQSLTQSGFQNATSISLPNDWQLGNNEVIILINDQGGALTGLLAQIPDSIPLINSCNANISINPSALNFCEDSIIILYADSIENASYVWYYNDNILSNSNGRTIQISSPGSYKVGIFVNGNYIVESNILNIDSCNNCTGSFGPAIINTTFGAGTITDLANAVPNATTTYGFNPVCPSDGLYNIANTSFIACGQFVTGTDHTGDIDGRMMIVNADGNQAGEFYRQKMEGLCAGTTYQLAAWLANLTSPSAACGTIIPANVQFEVLDAFNLSSLGFVNTGDIPITSSLNWIQYDFEFTAVSDSVIIILKNNGLGGCGNDLAIDDITLRACSGGSLLTINSQDTLVCLGSTAIMNAQVNATEELDFQWQKSIDNGLTWVDISNANTLEYEIPSFQTSDEGLYRLTAAPTGNIGSENCRFISNTNGISLNYIANPIANFTSTLIADSVILTNQSINAIHNFWSFGDNQSEISANPVHYYTTDGEYEINLLVINTCGISDTAMSIINICNSTPVIRISGMDKFCDTIGTRLILETCNTDSIKWYKDGLEIIGENADTLDVINSGIYHCSILNNSQWKLSDTIVIQSFVSPIADFTLSQNCLTVTTTNLSSNAQSYVWDFGNTVSSALMNPTYMYNNQGNYLVSLSAKNNICIDTQSLFVSTLNTPVFNDIFATTCDNYIFNNQTLTQSGTYYDTLANALGCDSIITLSLTINTTSSTVMNETACETYVFNNQTLTQSGTYYDTLVNTLGCDSIITLSLTINTNPSPTIDVEGFSLSTQIFDTYQWYLNNNPIAGANAQSITTNTNGNYYVIVVDTNNCENSSSAINISGVNINEHNNNLNCSVYPNPFSEKINIKIYNEDEFLVEIFAINGQKLIETKFSKEINLNTKEWIAGIYFLKITDKSSLSIYTKIVK